MALNQPIHNPMMPFVGLVPGGSLQPGLMIRINGTISPNANQFAINLQLGPRVNPRDDIALHFSPIFYPPQRVVRNSLKSLQWGAEESHGPFPFVAGQQFEIIILVEHNFYKIAINGYHYCEFNHRLPFNHVSHITADGDFIINSLLFETSSSSANVPHSVPSYSPHMPSSSQAGMPPYPVGSSQPYGAPPMPPYPQASGSYMGQPPNQPYPTQGPVFHPGQQPPGVFQPTGAYPQAYPGAYPGQSFPSSSKPYKKNKGILSGGLLGPAAAVGGGLLGASLLSRAVPKMKLFKGPKFFKSKGFKHKGFGFMGKHKGFGGGFMGKHKGFKGFKGFKSKGWGKF